VSMPGSAGDLDVEAGRHLLTDMLRIRRFEERCVELYSATEIRGFLHLSIGEEACAVGVMQALGAEDAIVSTYREHGHALARGLSMRSVMAELEGKLDGCSRGRGGSMHLFDVGARFYGGNAIVAGGLPLAIGLALADHLTGRQRVTACFFGDGAVAEGEFHESMNLAALWHLPVLFCCENNLYAMDVLAVAHAAREATAGMRRGGGPHFLELRTYRFRAHSMYDPDRYRSKEEIEGWRHRDPITLLGDLLRSSGGLDDGALEAMERDITGEIDDAVAFAAASAIEPVEDLERFVTSTEVER